LVRYHYPRAEILIVNDAGVGIGMSGDPDEVEDMAEEWNSGSGIPQSCEGCFDRGHLMPLLAWQLEHDSNVRAGIISSFRDLVITLTFGVASPEAFEIALLEESSVIAERFPDRFRRFLFADPRTGEIIRTVVRMDSWRSLIDYNIYAGLVPAAGPTGLNMTAEAFTMARRRQHTAHEIGHTIGLAHNFIAATQDRASVMDYPVPMITVDAQGRLDLSRAYAPMAGGWDSLAIRYGYTWYPDARAEEQGLAQIVNEGLRRGLRFVGDQHAGAEGSIPAATRWTEGRTMFEAVERTTAVRRVAIDKFDERAIQPGDPMYLLNMRFAHVYLHHRYSLEGLVKYVGGMDFRYAMRGDGQTPTTIVPAAEQRRALTMALDALQPAALAVPERVMALIPPVPPGGDGALEWIGSAGGTSFDQISLAGGLATEVIQGLMDRERLARVVMLHARDPQLPTLADVLGGILERTWYTPTPTSPNDQAIRRAVQRVVLNTFLDRAGDTRALADVRQVTAMHLTMLSERLSAMTDGPPADRALRAAARREIDAFLDGADDPSKRSRFQVIPLPWP
jgi:hypothetical protein